MSYKRILTACCLTLLVLIAAPVGFSSETKTEQAPVLSVDSLAGQIVLSDLPIERVESFQAEKASGTVVLLPQYHKHPGTDSSDDINDSALRSQKQIYSVLEHLIETFGVSLLMTEGGLYGHVPKTEIEPVQAKLVLQSDFKTQLKSLETVLKNHNLDEKTEAELLAKLKEALSESEKSIMLEGAALVLKAGGEKVSVYGTENKETLEKSRALVKDYIYLTDRLKQTKRGSQRNRQDNARLFNSEALELLSTFLGKKGADSEFGRLKQEAELLGEEDVKKELEKTEQLYHKLVNDDQFKNLPQVLSGSGSRSDNPYSRVTDRRQLEQKVEEAEADIDELIVDQRNRETAEYAASALQAEKQDVLALQYGAGHTEGLVRELNKQNLSVIVIVTEEIEQRANSQEGRGG